MDVVFGKIRVLSLEVQRIACSDGKLTFSFSEEGK